MAAFLFRSVFICSLLSACIVFDCRAASALDSIFGDRVCSLESVAVVGQHPLCDRAIHDIYNATEIRTASVESLRQFTCGESAAIGERMFRCELCQSVVPAGTRSSKVILVTRDKTYDERGGGGFASRGGFRKRGPSRGSSPKKDYDKGGEGQEIVREASVCPKCAAEHKRQLDLESTDTNEGAE